MDQYTKPAMPSREFAQLTTNASQIWSHPTWDLLLILVLFGAGFFYGLSAGKKRISTTILSTYVTLALFPVIRPFLERMIHTQGDAQFFIPAGLFLALFLVLSFLLGGNKTKLLSRGGGSWGETMVLSFAQVGLLLHLLLSFLPKTRTTLLAPLTKYLFANQALHIWWLLLPLIALIIIRRFNKE
ncbi:MAG: Uncharacterized protein G01um101466_325 [Parcubacteria group bacterium Gr01-1014_66]|nr:MAG: Uncharacterized protein G01um101466_325 [Parcubacteria group bacterium Gr01-1014_66]